MSVTVSRVLYSGGLLVIGLGFILPGIVGGSNELRYVEGSAVAEGTVITLTNSTRRGPRRTTVAYGFTTPDGRRFVGSDQISQWDARQLREGGPVLVHYLPSEPTKSQLRQAGEGAIYVVWLAIGTGCLAISVAFMRAKEGTYFYDRYLARRRQTRE